MNPPKRRYLRAFCKVRILVRHKYDIRVISKLTQIRTSIDEPTHRDSQNVFIQQFFRSFQLEFSNPYRKAFAVFKGFAHERIVGFQVDFLAAVKPLGVDYSFIGVILQ